LHHLIGRGELRGRDAAGLDERRLLRERLELVVGARAAAREVLAPVLAERLTATR
jgi:hypothetical protein